MMSISKCSFCSSSNTRFFEKTNLIKSMTYHDIEFSIIACKYLCLDCLKISEIANKSDVENYIKNEQTFKYPLPKSIEDEDA